MFLVLVFLFIYLCAPSFAIILMGLIEFFCFDLIVFLVSCDN